MREIPVNRIFVELERNNLLPSILFRSSRKQCDEDVERLAGARSSRLSDKDSAKIAQQVSAVMDKYQVDRDLILNHPHYQALLESAVGAHHAGQLLVWRLLLEELMSAGQLKMLIATGTVAAGVDFPARSVVVTAHSRRGNEGFQDLSSSEFQQMSGRAGRRGKDAVGFCIVAPGQFCDARVVDDIARRPPEPLRSSYFAAPATVLNLLKHRSVEELRFTISKSLAAFVDNKSGQIIRQDALKLSEELEQLKGKRTAEQQKKAEKRVKRHLREADLVEQRQTLLLEKSLEGLRALGHLTESGSLTEKGTWSAELCTSLILHLSEGVDRGVFYDKSEYQLAALIASIAGDSHRKYFHLAENPIAAPLYREMETIIKDIKEKYHGAGALPFLEVQKDAALTVLTWMRADSWLTFASLVRLSGLAEGDAARLISQTADHLQQLTRLKDTHPGIAETASEARRLLLRPPLVDALIASD